MKHLIIFALLSLAALQGRAQALSDTIPTASLRAFFLTNVVSNTTETRTRVYVNLYEMTTVNNAAHYTPLILADDEQVQFQVGSTTLNYNAHQPDQNFLPTVAGGVYTVTFKRFNGETYTSTATLPKPVYISKPTEHSVFQSNEQVDIAWNDVKADYLVGYLSTSNCRPTMAPMFKSTSGVIPANFSSGCPGPVHEFLEISYLGTGTAFTTLRGTLAAISSSQVNFDFRMRTDDPDTREVEDMWIHQMEKALDKHGEVPQFELL